MSSMTQRQPLLAKYEQWKSSQRKEDPYHLPISHTLKWIVQKILKEAPDTKTIYLTGSYASGSYITEDTPQQFRELKRRVKNKSNISDIDIVIEPYYDPQILGVDVQTVYRPNKLVLYQSDNLIKEDD